MPRLSFFVSKRISVHNILIDSVLSPGAGIRNGQSVWTSGRLCNFNDDCKRADLQPIKVNGWFWATPRVRMLPSDQRTPFSPNRAVNDWSGAGK